jgi:hypothetical protein
MMIDLDSLPHAHSEREFISWLSTAKPGDAIEYYRGTSVGRCPSHMVGLPWRVREEADKGMVHLFQRRVGPVPAPACVGEFAYLAVKADGK